MFSGRFDTKPSEDGSYFIDCDGTHFRYILNYLRTGQLIVPKDEIIRDELLSEAEFYQVEEIIYDLRAGSLQDSSILSSDRCKILITWLRDTWNQKRATCSLACYIALRGMVALRPTFTHVATTREQQ